MAMLPSSMFEAGVAANSFEPTAANSLIAEWR
jgi:hypothetical protein